GHGEPERADLDTDNRQEERAQHEEAEDAGHVRALGGRRDDALTIRVKALDVLLRGGTQRRAALVAARREHRLGRRDPRPSAKDALVVRARKHKRDIGSTPAGLYPRMRVILRAHRLTAQMGLARTPNWVRVVLTGPDLRTRMTSTETVTVLFTDMPRSTERSSALGTAAADELRRMHFALLRGAIAE